jgi:hypothetical protein
MVYGTTVLSLLPASLRINYTTLLGACYMMSYVTLKRKVKQHQTARFARLLIYL